MTELVHLTLEAGVATITLDSPHNRNALSQKLVDQLLTALTTVGTDDAVRAVELTHAGPVFCAGADLAEASAGAGSEASGPSVTRAGSEASGPRIAGVLSLMRAIVEMPKPVVATVDGHVRAGGLGLIGAADIVLAGRGRSTFAFAEARIGVTPAVISMTTAGRMSDRSVSRYFLTGASFDADTAARIGLITEAVDDVSAGAATIFDELRLCSPQGLRETKRLTAARVRAALTDRSADLTALSARLFDTDEAREGMAAFLAKRRPEWVSA